MAVATSEDVREQLLKNVKKEVKQIMEEAVTRKFVHEDSACVSSLCGAVEACLQYGLRKRSLGLFKNSTTTALLQKIAKTFEPAAKVVKLLKEFEKNCENHQKSENKSHSSIPRYTWVRLALFDKQLSKIVEYLIHNASKYYEMDSIVSEPGDALIMSSLLVGPCSLEYSKMKTRDHYWTDPPADELVQRHRIHSTTSYRIISNGGSPKRPGLQIRRNQSSSSEESFVHTSAKDYVKSLHQNLRSTLLYGKNNVYVQPKDDIEPLAGYLSLHQDCDKLNIKWTPNQLMNGCNMDEEATPITAPGIYWEYAVTVCLNEIVYIHCHQQPNSGGTVILVGQDGVQRPPLHFPKGGHLLSFLSCLENGLLPHGHLDPPLWTQRGKGKVFPRLKLKSNNTPLESMSSRGPSVSTMSSQSSVLSSVDGGLGQTMIEEEEATDYVFRIVVVSYQLDHLTESVSCKADLNGVDWPVEDNSVVSFNGESTVESDFQAYARSQQQSNAICTRAAHRNAVKQLCDSMKCQILSRAFYGWLSHCRHLKTVRTHLSGMVNPILVSLSEPRDASLGLTSSVWESMNETGEVIHEFEVYRLVYFGGCDRTIRPEVWPYLLGYYKFGSTREEREEQDVAMRQQYENIVSEWLAVEAIIQQQDKELFEANLIKMSCEVPAKQPLVHKDSTLSNEVFFESQLSDDLSLPETVPEETSLATSPSLESKNELTNVNLGITETALQTSAHKILKSQHQVLTEVKSTDSKESRVTDDDGLGDSIAHGGSSSDSKHCDSCDMENMPMDPVEVDRQRILITNATIDMTDWSGPKEDELDDQSGLDQTAPTDVLPTPTSPVISNASNGGVYTQEFLESVAINIHRIDKDVQRCDRNYSYFTLTNLDKLRNVMCTYVWENIEVGYIQGMCDLVAPLLVVLDDEAKTYGCFCQLMKRMITNFQHGGAMDQHFGNMRSLIQILDPELFEHMHQNGDYTHFYFCYRWFLLDFKRELLYDDVFLVWELIWSAKHTSSSHFALFFALALVEYYREIIIDNNMDFTDIIKFFNEMAERHDIKKVMQIARDLVARLQDLIQNK